MRGRFPLFSLALVLASCVAPEPGPGDELVDERSDEIINGQLDTTHQAVVAVFSNSSSCTGTIIHRDGNQGFVLTAAHCISNNNPPKWVVQGNDYNSGSAITYPVVAYQRHASYNNAVYDFGMIRFSGASAATPVIPAMTKAQDNLAAGSQVTFVGYGLTENGPTSKRRFVAGTLSKVSSLLLEYTQQNGGPCSGDSGGPSLSVVNGQEVVSGVTSYGDQNCTQFGASGRTSAIYESFILPFINGSGGGTQTCDQCVEATTSGTGTCSSQTNACFANSACAALVQCLNGCTTSACQDNCVSTHSAGVNLYSAMISCICDSGCPSECATQCGGSQPEPKCGFTAQAKTCETCLENSCCSTAKACADDPVCQTCFGSTPAGGCDTNAKAAAFLSCLGNNCSDECGVEPGGGGEGGGGEGGAGEGGDETSGAGGSTKKPAGAEDKNSQTVGGCSAGRAPVGAPLAPVLSLLALALVGALRRRRETRI